MSIEFINGIFYAALGLLPVVLFMVGLVFLDSFKLLSPRAIIKAIAIGCIIAGILLLVHMYVLNTFTINETFFIRYVAPLTEEIGKAVYIFILIRIRKVGFMVDAAIIGFSIGTGFALVENLYYLWTLAESSPLVWIIRGCGTAVMHGGTTAIFAVVTKTVSDSYSGKVVATALPGIAIAVILHSFFNHFLLSPVAMAILTICVLPVLFIIIFHKSEIMTREWLGYGLDKDVELLRMIIAGNISETRIGRYLKTLQEKFPGMIVADMLNYLRVYLELSVRAKGILIMKETGYRVPPDPEIQERFRELSFLEKSIGRTGKRALYPLLKPDNKDLWQLHMINK